MKKNRLSRSFSPVLTVVALFLSMVGCAQPAPPTANTPTPSETFTVYPVPEGCPSAKDLGNAWGGSDLFVAIDPELLDTEVATALPKGGCAYLEGDVHTAKSSSATYRDVVVWYFNLGQPGKAVPRDISNWATSAGGTSATTAGSQTPENFDLPKSFTNWTGATVKQRDGENSRWGWDKSVIPAHTQGAQAQIYFAIDSEKADALLRASAAGTTADDPTKALAQGLAAHFTGTVDITDDQGYTAQVTVEGRLQPFTKDVTEARPGQFNAISSATVAGTLTNTTPQRQTQTTPVSVIALYPFGSEACGGSSNGISVKGADWQKSSYCAITIGGVAEAALAPGARQDLASKPTSLKLGTYPESGKALSQLNTPTSIYMYFGGKTRSLLTEPNWHGNNGCQAQTGSWGGQWFTVMTGWPDVICG